MLDYLVIAPHPDDAELAMGGTIAKLPATGASVAVCDLTDGEPTPFGDPATRARETAEASAHLGLTQRFNLGLPNRTLQATLEARVKLAELIRRLRPRRLFCPYWEDAHPDHVAATRLIEDARFHAKLTKTDMAGEPWHPERIIHYYCTHLRHAAQPAFVIDISDQWPAKLAAMKAYQSQFYVGRGSSAGAVIEMVSDLNRYWGRLIGTQFGEPFALREPLGLKGLGDMV